ncbi:MAG TPA: hypothetical protein VKA94_12935, partial [Hyphomicrobiales bacterium]|nr:hypothetical protein [Hyphomicrobiales bacterium]
EYVEKLRSSKDNPDELGDLLSKMKTDKKVRMRELNAIAQQYVGGTSKYKNASEAYKEIQLRFDAHITGKRRLGAASEIF